jgi:hypothetical protein
MAVGMAAGRSVAVEAAGGLKGDSRRPGVMEETGIGGSKEIRPLAKTR